MGGRGRAEGSEGTPGRKKRRQKQGSPPQVGDEITTELDSYSLLEPIGEGTFSVVFKARAKKKDHGHAIVAAKILKDGQSDYSRVHQEYLCLAALKGHENVVEVLDGCSDGCRITLLMPYFEHGDFGESLHNGDFTDVHISCYMRGLFAALVHVHREGFIHRDIKPTNVLYNFESRRTMVVDFGLVQTREQASQIQSAAAPRDSHAGSPRNRASRPPAAAAGAEASRGSVARGARGATTTTTTTTTTADSGASGSTAPGRRAARSAPNAPLPGFRVPSGHLFGGVGHLQTLLARSAGVILLCLLTKRYPIFDATDDQYALQEICVLLGPHECAHAARFNYELTTWENEPRENAPASQGLAHFLSGQQVDAPWVELVCSCLRLDPKQRSSAKKAGDSSILSLGAAQIT